MSEEPIHEDGCEWREGREALEAWRAYKRQRAISLVGQGFSVSWSPDPHNGIEVYLPERWYARESEMRAYAMFFSKPSAIYGIRGGRISKLAIIESVTGLASELARAPAARTTWYNYDRGLDVDRLHESPRAQLLYEAVIDELN